MQAAMSRPLTLLTLALLLCVQACRKEEPSDAATGPQPQPSAAPLRVTGRPANTQGDVFVLMYHRVVEKPGPYDRTPANFKKDLETLYEKGFRPITLSQYVSGKFDLAPGASPVVFTFDDSDPSQFRYLENGAIDPDCAVGVWQNFAKEHPDFPVRASFFVLQNGPFRKDGEKKVKQLIEWGCDVASHTLHHVRLDKISEDEIKNELAGTIDWLQSLGVKNPGLLSLPYGRSPKDKSVLFSFWLDGKEYKHDAALLVGAGPAPSPNSVKFDAFAVPRIQATEAERGITYWLDKVDQGKVALYVQP